MRGVHKGATKLDCTKANAQQITEEPLCVCPICGGKVRRLISGGGGLLFKGNGFYITDHRSESYKKRAREDKGLPAKTNEKKEKKEAAAKKD